MEARPQPTKPRLWPRAHPPLPPPCFRLLAPPWHLQKASTPQQQQLATNNYVASLSTEDMSRVKHSFGDGPLVPFSDLRFLYSPSAATSGFYVHTPQKTKP